MSREYNLAGKQLVVDGITVLGNKKKQRSALLSQAITNGELARDNALTGEQVQALGGTVIIISEDLTETKGRVTTNKNNIEGLDGRMGTAEGNITSQGSRLDTAEGNITSQGNRLTTAEGNISSQGGRITTAEGNISGLQQVTKRFDVRSLQTTIIRDDARTESQIIVLKSTIIGYDNPVPRLAIQTGTENCHLICAMDNNPTAAVLESLVEGTSVNPTPSAIGSWYRGGLAFQVGGKAAYVINNGGAYTTAIITITAVTDSSVTGTIDVGGVLTNTAVGVDDRDVTNVSLYIPFRRAGRVIASLYNDMTLMDQLTIPVSDTTRRWKELPAVDRYENLPQTETEGGVTKYLVDGDCAVVRFTGNPEAFTATTYIYKSGTWVPASEEAQYSDAAQLIQTIYSAVEEAQQYKTDHPDFNFENIYVGSKGLFDKIMVGLVYAAKIFAEEILSSEWDGLDADGYPKKGFRLSTRENMIQAVAAILKGARIRESDLFDVSISSLDADKTILFKTNKTILPPTVNPMTFNNEANGVYVESNIRSYSWQPTPGVTIPMTDYSGYRRFVGSTNKNQSFEFTVENDCTLYIRAPYWARTILWGTPGTMAMSISVNGSEVWYSSGVAYNNDIGDFFDFNRGDFVEVNITFIEGSDGGITTKTEGSLVVVLKYYDILDSEEGGGGDTSKGMAINHYGKFSTISWSAGGSSGTFDLFFPFMKKQAQYNASDLAVSTVLVDGQTATSKASLVTNSYDAVAPFLEAKGTQGGQQVNAIPRGSVITFTQTTVYYKRDPYVVNQLLLTENEVTFFLNERIQFSIFTDESSTLNYSITLLQVDPSLTVSDLIPVDGNTDLGKEGNNGAFDKGYINTVKTRSIQKQYGQTLDIQADTISGDLTGDVQGDLTGNVNSAGTANVVYGAVFN